MFRRTKANFDDVKPFYDDDTVLRPSYKQFERSPHKETSPSVIEERLVTSRHTSPDNTPIEESSTTTSSSQSYPYASSITTQEDEPETTLGEGVTFKGELVFEKLLRIDGKFEGVLVSQGKIIVGPHGYVKSDIQLEEAIIEGTVDGNITVSGKLELRGGARIQGNIQAKTMIADEGVAIQGHVHILGLAAQGE